VSSKRLFDKEWTGDEDYSPGLQLSEKKSGASLLLIFSGYFTLPDARI